MPKQVYEKRYFPDWVRAFRIQDEYYYILSPKEDWIGSEDMFDRIDNLMNETQGMVAFSELEGYESQLRFVEEWYGEEVIL